MGVDKLKLVNNLYSVVNPSSSRNDESGIDDTGASGNYLKADVSHEFASWPVVPIQEKQPNVQVLHSTKVCRLALSTLPKEAREAPIIP